MDKFVHKTKLSGTNTDCQVFGGTSFLNGEIFVKTYKQNAGYSELYRYITGIGNHGSSPDNDKK